MSLLLPLSLAALLGVSSTAWAAEPRPADVQASEGLPALVEIPTHLGIALPGESGRAPPSQGIDLRGIGSATDDAGAERGPHERPSLELHLGRASAVGRMPGDLPPAYGEIGVDIDSLAGLSLVSSYRLVLEHEREGEQDARTAADHLLKLGARVQF